MNAFYISSLTMKSSIAFGTVYERGAAEEGDKYSSISKFDPII
jgi:hypothetical protein